MTNVKVIIFAQIWIVVIVPTFDPSNGGGPDFSAAGTLDFHPIIKSVILPQCSYLTIVLLCTHIHYRVNGTIKRHRI